jgi:CTP:molybdopterin cytidylyltransferase MocA
LGLSGLIKPTYTFIQNIDNPFVTETLIKKMMATMQPNCYVNPAFEGKKGHPVFISPPIVQDILYDKSKKPTLKHYLKGYHSLIIEQSTNDTLKNINSLADYNNYINEN